MVRIQPCPPPALLFTRNSRAEHRRPPRAGFRDDGGERRAVSSDNRRRFVGYSLARAWMKRPAAEIPDPREGSTGLFGPCFVQFLCCRDESTSIRLTFFPLLRHHQEPPVVGPSRQRVSAGRELVFAGRLRRIEKRFGAHLRFGEKRILVPGYGIGKTASLMPCLQQALLLPSR